MLLWQMLSSRANFPPFILIASQKNGLTDAELSQRRC
jgi:hypothetical protein